MQIALKEDLINLLNRIGEELDIPEHIERSVISEYQGVAEWLHAEDSSLKQHEPQIYPQGSFRLGTTVRPYNSSGEYDIDLVCCLQFERKSISKKELKELVGNRLSKNKTYNEMLTEKGRCWRLDYPRQFHMDILPSIPNDERPPQLEAILLTDIDLREWLPSNPIAYANWFYQRMQIMVVRLKESVLQADASYKTIQDVPDWKIRTPLQRAVQILKRHRDIYFANNSDLCPVSITLTTLAAKAYNNEENVYDAVIGLVNGMERHIENRDGVLWVPNPVEPDENFADKWNIKREKYIAFIKWLEKVKEDFEDAVKQVTFKEARAEVSKALKVDINAHIATSLKVHLSLAEKASPALSSPPSVPPIGDTSHALPLEWPTVTEPFTAHVTSEVYFRKHGRVLWPNDKTAVIPKGKWIRFTVTTDVPKPYTVKWQVVNTGSEAQTAGQKRGGFYNSDAHPRERWESTAYWGTHTVEAIIIKDGKCVARSGQINVKISKY